MKDLADREHASDKGPTRITFIGSTPEDKAKLSRVAREFSFLKSSAFSIAEMQNQAMATR